MDSRTGKLYSNRDEALAAGVPEDDIVELAGTPKAVKRISRMVRRADQLEKKLRRERERGGTA